MKDLFYTLISFILILFIITGTITLFVSRTHHKLPETANGIIIHKTENVLGQRVNILTNQNTVGAFNCYDILFDEIEVGDTIKNGQIYKVTK